MSKYIYPKGIVVTEGTSKALDDLYDYIKGNKDAFIYFKNVERMTEDRMIDLSIIYGQETCNLMCWIIKNGKFDVISKVKKSSVKKQH